MSDKMGPLVYGKREEQIFLGREIDRHQDYSEATAVSIDEEIQKVVFDRLTEVRHLLNEHRNALHALAQSLLEKEVLDGMEIDEIIATSMANPPQTEIVEQAALQSVA